MPGSILFVFLRSLLNFVLPPRRATARLLHREGPSFTVQPIVHELEGVSVITLLDYHEPAVRDALWSLKYERGSDAARLCALALADFLMEEIAAVQLFSPRPILLVPIPLHADRLRERGYNQITRVLGQLKALPHDVSINQRILARTHATSPQTKLSRSERLKNVAGAFEVRHAEQVRGTHVFLIDDITTTGATLLHSGKPLLEAGALVTRIALARA